MLREDAASSLQSMLRIDAASPVTPRECDRLTTSARAAAVPPEIPRLRAG